MADDHALPIVRTVASLRAHITPWRERGQTVALVPTMGSLHEGHLSLVRMARQQADHVIASVFVNPRQFGPKEDFDAYPRDETADARMLALAACDLMYAPGPLDMYPAGFSTSVSVGGISEILCGAARPGHFNGVATVVTKLLTQVAPDVAIFGEKDYQQLQIIRRLARDLDLRLEVLGAPVVRARDGLALSSRNAYLSKAEREVAPRLHAILAEAEKALAAGEPVAAVESRALAALSKAGFTGIDYLEVRGAEDLTRQGPGPVSGPARVLAAAWLGKTRLIDNVAVG
ncbi:MAG TPA: pantoate--beta-alanine ligase [Caulobacteraceae bacterium]|jgi:pantoate--beta-alanine ligase|nr:pantoate--beta-alanine ligase [Caulobacteraceae bacterium]